MRAPVVWWPEPRGRPSEMAAVFAASRQEGRVVRSGLSVGNVAYVGDWDAFQREGVQMSSNCLMVASFLGASTDNLDRRGGKDANTGRCNSTNRSFPEPPRTTNDARSVRVSQAGSCLLAPGMRGREPWLGMGQPGHCFATPSQKFWSVSKIDETG